MQLLSFDPDALVKQFQSGPEHRGLSKRRTRENDSAVRQITPLLQGNSV
jgi:hypothetical protein